MEIRIHYRHISHDDTSSEDIQNWLTQYFNKTVHIDPIVEKRGFLIDVFFSKSRIRNGSSKAQFECHMLARAPWLRKDVFAKAKAEDFWIAMSAASHILKKQITKDRLQRRGSRHHQDHLFKVG